LKGQNNGTSGLKPRLNLNSQKRVFGRDLSNLEQQNRNLKDFQKNVSEQK
jgi:hypothetical protein